MRAPATQGRIAYLESIRGLAALQVVLLHFLTATMPQLVFFSAGTWNAFDYVHASPVFLLYDGQSAVYIFFVLSGYVLTGAFARQVESPLKAALARVARLGVPAFAAVVFAAAFFLVFGGVNLEAGGALNSNFLRDNWLADPSIAGIARESLFNALFVGYRPLGLFASTAPSLAMPMSQSLDSPLWTLSFEFYGSLLVLALCWIGSRSARSAALAAALCAVVLIRNPLADFVVGYGLARIRFASAAPKLPAGFAILCVAIGGLICVKSELTVFLGASKLCGADVDWMFACLSAVNLQKSYGAMLVFIGVTQLAALRRWLACEPLTYLGKLSFPLYLTHWPVIFGLGAFLVAQIAPRGGIFAATAVCFAVMVVVCFAFARLFSQVDRFSMRLSRQIGASATQAAVVPAFRAG